MSIYTSLSNAISNAAITKPIQQVAIPSQFKPTYIGPRFSETNISAPYIPNWQPPQYDPVKSRKGTVFNQASGNVPDTCPRESIWYRNEFEAYNTTNGKYSGGMDIYNINNIPSCNERDGIYMNIQDYITNPFARSYVDNSESQDKWFYNAHF
jgi:hypothetical protein